MHDPPDTIDLANDVNLEPDNATGIGTPGGDLPGPIPSGMLGGALGATAGGLIGTLVNEGVREEAAKHYQTGIERGGILVTVQPPDGQEDKVRAVLTIAGLRGIEVHRQRWEADPNYNYQASDRTFIDPTRKAPI